MAQIKKSKQLQKKAQVHVMLDAPIAIRRMILNCALDTTHLVKEAHEVQAVREKKLKTLRKLERVIKEIKSIMRQFSEVHVPIITEGSIETIKEIKPHPHLERNNSVKQEVHEKEAKHLEVKKPSVSKGPKSDIDKLKDELRDIESKLKAL